MGGILTTRSNKLANGTCAWLLVLFGFGHIYPFWTCCGETTVDGYLDIQ